MGGGKRGSGRWGSGKGICYANYIRCWPPIDQGRRAGGGGEEVD